MNVDWFRRFGDIPGISFAGTPGLDPRRLPGYGAVPEVHAHEFEGKRRETLLWRTKDGIGSASPANSSWLHDANSASPANFLRDCYQRLELPGEPMDYHFLIQSCASNLWKRRKQAPETLEDVEKLCWLDIQLIEARPDAVTDEFSDEPKFFNVLTFKMLIDLYEREGFLHDAFDVAERAARYGQGLEARERLAERIAAVENEGE